MNKPLSYVRYLCIDLASFLILSAFACAEAGTGSLPTVSITAESLTDWTSKKDVRDAVLTLTSADGQVVFTGEITIQPQGTSSLAYDKKNFTIKFPGGAVEVVPEWGAQSEYCLKANYIDPTHACNVVSAKLAAQINEAYGLFESTPNYGAVDGFPIWVLLNGEPAGLYTWNIPKAAWMFGMDEENSNHIVFACEGWTEACQMYAETFVLDEEWSIEVGSDEQAAVEKFNRLLRFVATASDEEFVRNFDQYLNLDACLNYYCFIAITDAGDNICKNMLMATYDGQVWYPVLYDLDSLYSIQADGMNVSQPVLSVAYNNNRLFTRIRDLFTDKMIERYSTLRSGIMSRENIWKEFNAFRDAIPATYFAQDQQMWNPDGKMIRTYEKMEELMRVYIPMVDEAFGFKPDYLR